MPGVQEPRNAGLLDFPEAGIRGGSLTLQNGSPFQTEPGHAGSRSDFSKAAVQLGVSTIRNEVSISLTSTPVTGRLQTHSIAFILRPLVMKRAEGQATLGYFLDAYKALSSAHPFKQGCHITDFPKHMLPKKLDTFGASKILVVQQPQSQVVLSLWGAISHQ